jgi:hypothetical protein
MVAPVKPVNFVRAAIVLAALSAASAGQAADAMWDAPTVASASLFLGEARSTGTSFLDHVRTTNAEEPTYSVPATFPGPLVPLPRRKPDARWMLLACVGLLVYLGRRRGKALAAAS